MVTRDQVKYAKPDPDLFLTAAHRLRVPIETSMVVGDSVWDMLAARRARALGVGCFPEATARMSWNARAPTASIGPGAICFGTLTRSACAMPPWLQATIRLFDPH